MGIIKSLSGARKDDRIVDIGGGTGRFASLIYSSLGLSRPVVCVDMSLDMLQKAQNEVGVGIACADAVQYAQNLNPASIDFALNKEIIHHLDMQSQVNPFFRGLYQGLTVGGKCITMTRPKVNISYPFFEKAKNVWMENAHSKEDLQKSMQAAGFSEVKCLTYEYPVSMPLSRWTGMVKDRMWSTFSNFSDRELYDGIKEIEETFTNDSGIVTYTERVYLIEGKKV